MQSRETGPYEIKPSVKTNHRNFLTVIISTWGTDSEVTEFHYGLAEADVKQFSS